MKYLFTALLLPFVLFSAFSQNQSVPGYVTTQDLPDSVRNVSLIRQDGIKLTLSQMLEAHKGKKLFVDIWASWCRDCITGLPKIWDLQKRTDENEVAYVFLSVDKDDTKWKTAIERFNIHGEHYRIEGAWKNPFSNYIVLDWIPRYVVFDGSGKVIMPKAIHADEKSLVDLLVPAAP